MMPTRKKQAIISNQSLEPVSLAIAVAFEMAHIKDRCVCTSDEKKDRNNFLALSPSLHKMFDGNQRVVPTVLISIDAVCSVDPRTEVGEDGRKENLCKVRLRVRYFSEEVARFSPIQFKDQTPAGRDGMEHLVEVEVTDHKAFEEYITWKMNNTKKRWEAKIRGRDGDDDNGGEDSRDDEEG